MVLLPRDLNLLAIRNFINEVDLQGLAQKLRTKNASAKRHEIIKGCQLVVSWDPDLVDFFRALDVDLISLLDRKT